MSAWRRVLGLLVLPYSSSSYTLRKSHDDHPPPSPSLNARERLRQRYRLHTRNNTESSFAGMLPNTSTSTFKFPATPSPPSEPLLAPSVLPWAYQDSLRSSIFSEHSQSQGYTRPGSIASSRRIPAPWLANEHVSGNGNGNGNGNGQGQGQGQGGKGQPRSQSPQRPQWGHLRNGKCLLPSLLEPNTLLVPGFLDAFQEFDYQSDAVHHVLDACPAVVCVGAQSMTLPRARGDRQARSVEIVYAVSCVS
ncbi:hypothetical protein AX16_006050 [Volvariella volvacea WC 439]|nr:hypothetical protein AX16_006050 [Volvariella volvacea WC 439]